MHAASNFGCARFIGKFVTCSVGSYDWIELRTSQEIFDIRSLAHVRAVVAIGNRGGLIARHPDPEIAKRRGLRLPVDATIGIAQTVRSEDSLLEEERRAQNCILRVSSIYVSIRDRSSCGARTLTSRTKKHRTRLKSGICNGRGSE